MAKTIEIMIDTSDPLAGVDCVADWAKTVTEEQREKLRRDWENLCANRKAIVCYFEDGKFVCNMSPEFMNMLKKHGVTHD